MFSFNHLFLFTHLKKPFLLSDIILVNINSSWALASFIPVDTNCHCVLFFWSQTLPLEVKISFSAPQFLEEFPVHQVNLLPHLAWVVNAQCQCTMALTAPWLLKGGSWKATSYHGRRGTGAKFQATKWPSGIQPGSWKEITPHEIKLLIRKTENLAAVGTSQVCNGSEIFSKSRGEKRKKKERRNSMNKKRRSKFWIVHGLAEWK